MSSDHKQSIFGIDGSGGVGIRIKNVAHEDWVTESMYFESPDTRQTCIQGSYHHINSSFTERKYKIFGLFVLVVLGLIFLRVAYIQIGQGAGYRAAAEHNRERSLPIVAERGLIYDRNGIALTKNIPNFSLAIIPQDLPKKAAEREKIVLRLAELTMRPEGEIRDLLDEYGSYSYESITIRENLEYDQALAMIIEAGDLPGIYIQRGSKRLYETDLNGGDRSRVASTSVFSLSHVLGYEGKLNRDELNSLYEKGYLPNDQIGKMGVEDSYEKYLRGVYGKKRIEVNAAGKEQSILSEEAPVPGSHIKLAIDARYQAELESLLSSYLKKFNKTRGSAVVLDPNNGQVLALVSLPTFDNNEFSGGISQENYTKYTENSDKPLFNRVIGGNYPSGSTIKPAIAAAALNEGVITAKTAFLSTGGLRIGQWFFPDWQAGGHGLTDVRRSLAWSVNTFYYYIGGGYDKFVGLGVDRIVQYLAKFGFAEKTGVDLGGETSGFLPSRDWKQAVRNEKWYIGDTYNLSIGQGDVLATPLQIALMTASVVNGGTLYEPHVVKAIVDPVTKRETPIASVVRRADFMNPSHLTTVKLGMQDCVKYGSCRALASLPISAGGKTGTAQWNSNKANHAWFTAFAPVERPQIVLTVMIEEGEEGSRTAVPVVRDFLAWWARTRN